MTAERQPFCGWCSREVVWSWTWSSWCDVCWSTYTQCATTQTCLRGDMSSSYSSLRMFRTVKQYFSEPFLVNFRFGQTVFPGVRVRFSFSCFAKACVIRVFRVLLMSSVVFLAICCIKVTTRPTGFTRLRLCVGVVLTLVTPVATDTSSVFAGCVLVAEIAQP